MDNLKAICAAEGATLAVFNTETKYLAAVASYPSGSKGGFRARKDHLEADKEGLVLSEK